MLQSRSRITAPLRQRRSIASSSPLLALALALLSAARGAGASQALAQARACQVTGRTVDLYGQGRTTPAGCLPHGAACPIGSAEVLQQCVARPGADGLREIAITLHVTCTLCGGDGGVDYGGSLLISVARLLRVPMQEIAVSLLLMSTGLRQVRPLQHFVLVVPGDSPPRTPGGVVQGKAEAYDLFVAMRIHTSRLQSGDVGLQALRNKDSGPLNTIMGYPGLVQVFEAYDNYAPHLRSIRNLQPQFKLEGLQWNEQPAEAQRAPTRRPTAQPTLHPMLQKTEAPTPAPPSLAPTPAPTAVPTPAARPSEGQYCGCSQKWLGDGVCQYICNTAACWYDLGDCPTPAPTVMGEQAVSTPDPTSTPTPGPSVAMSSPTPSPIAFCTCNKELGDGVCDEACNNNECYYDMGDCPWGGRKPTAKPTSAPLNHWKSVGLRGTAAAEAALPPSAPDEEKEESAASAARPSDDDAVQGESGLPWHMIDSGINDTAPWYVEEIRYEGGVEQFPMKPAIISITAGVLLVLCCLCCLPKRQKGTPVEDTQLDWRGQPMDGRSESKQSRESKASWTSWASTRAPSSVRSNASEASAKRKPWFWSASGTEAGAGSPTSSPTFWSPLREAKVHPEPDGEPEPLRWTPSANATRATWREEVPMAAKSSKRLSTPASPSGAKDPLRTAASGGGAPASGAAVSRGRSRDGRAEPAEAARPPRAGAGLARGASEPALSRSQANAQAASSRPAHGKKASRSGAGRNRSASAGPRLTLRGALNAAAGAVTGARDAAFAAASGTAAGISAGASAVSGAAHDMAAGSREAASAARRVASEAADEWRAAGSDAAAAMADGARASASTARAASQATRNAAAGAAAGVGAAAAAAAAAASAARQAAAQSFRSEEGSSRRRAPPPSRSMPEQPRTRASGPPRTPQASNSEPPRRSTAPPVPPKAANSAPAPPPAAPRRGRAASSAGPAPPAESSAKSSFFRRRSEPTPKREDPEKKAESLLKGVQAQLNRTRGEPLEERRRLFRELQRQLHPDKNLENPEAAKLAFQTLMDSRADYLQA
eukprot:TRINITY_DN18491_c0_g3_i1.p1 TRINITY_DN18491_c0_g3~~TRINITY_DN18491_c0_g3_i1.p1  ORF type:complete len:1054 (-),score=193.41 TRINITY_DN18491_c0_g3_i1:208-3369(-)